MSFSDEQTVVLNKYTKKLIKNLILPTIKPIVAPHEKDLKEVYIEPKVVSYLAVKNMSEGDFSFLICTYNLYKYKDDGKKQSLMSTENSILNRGSIVSAVSISYKDTKLLFGDSIVEPEKVVNEKTEVENTDVPSDLKTDEESTPKQSDSEPKDVTEEVKPEKESEEENVEVSEAEQNKIIVQEEISEYVINALENIKSLKIKEKTYVLNGILQKPTPSVKKYDIKAVMLAWRLSVDKTIINKVFPEVYKALVEEVIKDKKADNFYNLDVVDTQLTYNGTVWEVLYKIKVTDAKTTKVVLNMNLLLPTEIKDEGTLYKAPMEELLTKKTASLVKNSRTQRVDKTSLSFKPFARLTNETDTLKADTEQTKLVFERVSTIFEKYKEENLIKNVTHNDGLLLVDVISKKYNENVKLLIGGEGFYIEGYAYTRKGLEKAGDKKYATDYLHNQLGFNILWSELLNCYDFRKNIAKEEEETK